jgi:SAM-dependent methyltransferase
MTPLKSPPQTSYDPKYFAPLFEAEDRHFWFRSRNIILSKIVEKYSAGFSDGFRLLEVGCGTGNVLSMLEKTCSRGKAAGMDLFSDGLRFARRRVKLPLIQGDILKPPFKPCFNMLCMFDVLEHLPDDIEILRSARRLLADGGRIMLTVPADSRLWSYFDTASHHYRRYTSADLGQKLAGAGYEVEFISPYMFSIYPVVRLIRRLTGRGRDGQPLDEEQIEKKSTGELAIIPVVNEILFRILSLEAGWLVSGRRFPAGTSLLAVARMMGSSDQDRG